MPYNVNPPCPSDLKTLIEWQYAGLAQKSTNLGDDYDVKSTVPFNVPRVTLYVTADLTYSASEGYEAYLSPVWSPPTRTSNANFIKSFPSIVTPGSFYPIVRDDGRVKQYRLKYERYSTSSGTTSRQDEVVFSTNHSEVFISGFSNIRVTVAPPQSNSSLIDYNLQIFKDTQVILTDTGKTLPTVTYRCSERCPPNTCQVDCGSVYCCYGSDGIAVSSFPK